MKLKCLTRPPIRGVIPPIFPIRVVSTGTFRMATADGAAAIYASDLDLSKFVNEHIVVEDSSGNQAVAYGYQADGAESLGSELITNGDFTNWTNDDPDNWYVNNEDANNYVTENPAGVANLVSDGTAVLNLNSLKLTTTSGKLYKVTCDITINIQGWRRIFNVIGESVATNSTNSGTLSFYGTNQGGTRVTFYRYVGGSSDYQVDNVSCKEVTALGTTALQLRDNRTGSTRNLLSKDSGFDPNNISKVKVYNF